MNIPPPSTYPSMDLAIAGMQSAVGAVTMKYPSSGGARTSAWANKAHGRTKSNSLNWIDEEVVKHSERHFACVYHARPKVSSAQLADKQVTVAETQGKKRRKVTSLSKNCGFRASIVCKATRASFADDPKHVFYLKFRADKDCSFSNGHSHDLSLTADAQFILPQNKKFTGKEVQLSQEYFAVGASNRSILLALESREEPCGRMRTSKDLTNLKAKRTRRDTNGGQIHGTGDILATIQHLVNIGAEFELHLEDNSRNEIILRTVDFAAECLITSLEKMDGLMFQELHILHPGSKQIADMYADVVGLDATHNTNLYRFHLYLSMVRDAEGHGHIITSSVLKHENNKSIRNALMFQRDVAGMSPSTILLDNDNIEIRAIRSVLPHANISICSFHVIKMAQEQWGPQYVPQDYRDDVSALWRDMVLATDDITFQNSWKKLQDLCTLFPELSRARHPIAPRTLPEFIYKNWIQNHLPRWARRYQQFQLSRGAFTNNTNESKHNTLKNTGTVNIKTSLIELVKTIGKTHKFDREKSRNEAARRLHFIEEHMDHEDSSLRLPLEQTFSGWLSSVSMNHMEKCVDHARKKEYRILTWSIQHINQWCFSVNMSMLGFSNRSVVREVQFVVAGSPPILDTTDANALKDVLDPRGFCESQCGLSCDSYANFGGTPCRHIVWAAMYTSHSCENGRLPLPISLFSKRDLTQTTFQTMRGALGDAETMMMQSSQTPLKTNIALQALPRMPSHQDGEQFFTRFMPIARQYAEIVGAEAEKCPESRKEAYVVSSLVVLVARYLLEFRCFPEMTVVDEFLRRSRTESSVINYQEDVAGGMPPECTQDQECYNSRDIAPALGAGPEYSGTRGNVFTPSNEYYSHLSAGKAVVRILAELQDGTSVSRANHIKGRRCVVWLQSFVGNIALALVSGNLTSQELGKASQVACAAAQQGLDALPVHLEINMPPPLSSQHSERRANRAARLSRQVEASQEYANVRSTQELLQLAESRRQGP